MSIKLLDLKSQYDKIKSEMDAAIFSCIESAAFINGKVVSEFAEELAAYLEKGSSTISDLSANNSEAKNSEADNSIAHKFSSGKSDLQVIPCANGTDALQIALMALDLKEGDEVILPAFTYIATAEVIALLKLKPVLVDVCLDDFNIDPKKIESAITPRTKCIVPVHLFGQCANMEAIMNIAKQYNLFVVEDTAQSIAAEYIFSDGSRRTAGSIGDIGTLSFFPTKNLGAYGDAGAMICRDAELAKKLTMIANHGQSKKYHHEIIGVNSRLDSLQAAILKVKLKYLGEYTSARQAIANYYDEALKGLDALVLPHRSKNSTHVFHQYTIRVLNNKRDALKDFLASKGIPSMIYYPLPVYAQTAYRRGAEGSQGLDEYQNTEQLCKEVLSIPIHPELQENELEYIVNTISAFLA